MTPPQDQFLPFFAYVSNLKLKRRKAFSTEFFLQTWWGGGVAGAVICWLLSYWFNCLFSSQPCLLIGLWRASDCAHCMHADQTRHQPQIPLSLNISLISLCLMSGTTQSWQLGKIPPSTTFLNLFSTTPFIDLPKAVRGVSRFMQKKSPHCSPMTVSLTIHYSWIPEDRLYMQRL